MEQAFNPISTDDTPGEVVLLVKVLDRAGLWPCMMTVSAFLHPHPVCNADRLGVLKLHNVDDVQEYAEGHPEAEMGRLLASLEPGQKVEVKGPFGPFKYQPGKYKAVGGCPLLWAQCLLSLPGWRWHGHSCVGAHMLSYSI